ncbi:MAG: DUF2971 domain-containing protein [Clostridia bacterium]|nr:DUF2971 domain-containing protein [Clostridia bacterium]
MKLQYEKQELYHYTSLQALKSIIENKTIRLTDYRFLNDKTELKYSIEVLHKYLLELKDKLKYYDKIIKDLSDLEKGITYTYNVKRVEKEKILLEPAYHNDTKFYILSMTDKSDDLALWSGYGKTGCCIKFNSQKLFDFFYRIRDRLFSIGLDNIVRGKIQYGNGIANDEKQFLINIFNAPEAVLNIPYLLNQLCSLRKESAYKYESEYRIGLKYYDEWFSKTDDQGKFFANKVFIEKDGFFKPQIEFNGFPIENGIIEEITISPYNKSDIALLGMQEFLFSNGLNEVKIQTSNIKIR